MDDFFPLVLGWLLGVFLLLIIIFGVFGYNGFFFVYDGDLICQERGFDSWSKVGEDVVCIRGEGERSEIRTAEWVEEHCSGQGICLDKNGEAISIPHNGGYSDE